MVVVLVVVVVIVVLNAAVSVVVVVVAVVVVLLRKKEDRIKERRANVIHPFVFALAFTRLQYIDLLYMYLSGLLIMYCAWIKHYALYRIRDCFLLLDLSC